MAKRRQTIKKEIITFQAIRQRLVMQSVVVGLIVGVSFASLTHSIYWTVWCVSLIAGTGCYWLSRLYIVKLLSKIDDLRSFNQDMAHELSVPVTALQARLQLLQRHRTTTAADAEQLTMLSAATDRLSELIHDYRVISLSEHIDKNRLSFIRMDHLVRQLAYEMTPLFTSKGIEVRFAQLDPATMIGNVEGIKRMVSNLLSNALRYGKPEGYVSVSVVGSRFEITFSIEDNGRGIAPQNLPHLFDRFYRVRQPDGEEESGSGLGLAIVKAVVDAHDGVVNVRSELERGTKFEITLPKFTQKQFLPFWPASTWPSF